jgi:tRNA C32,U32 (ribose-2'-O)-methylase TrmJ
VRVTASSESLLDRLRVVLVATRNPLNIGAAARAMTNFGFSRLRVVNPFEIAFREAKSAVGASAVLKRAEEYSNVAEAVADCTLVVGTTAVRDRHLDHPLRMLAQASSLVRKRMRTGRVALLFGSEQPSMNLGQAVAVCLYEISRGSKAGLLSERPPSVTASNLERLAVSLLGCLRVSGYAFKGKQDELMLRRFVHRLKLSGADAQLLMGMLRQMQWKMDKRD